MLLVLLVGVFIAGDSAFAQTVGSNVEGFNLLRNEIGGGLTALIKLMSRLWIVPASIAGELMTNKFAFGSPFYLDRYLFRIWQFMRTMGLFALGFILVGSIIKIYVTQKEVKEYWTLLKRTIIAGILISFSWFLIAAIVDLSIIATSAVASIPLNVLEQEFKSMENKLICSKKVTVKNFGSLDELDIEENDTQTLTFEQIMPKGDSVSGPLIFMGCGMLNFFELTDIDTNTKEITTSVTLQIIKILISLLMVIPMIVLMVVNLMRIFFIRLRAMFGPIIVLDLVFKGPLTKDGGSYQKYFTPGNIIGLVFQPVVVVGALSIGMLMIMGIYDVNVGGEKFEAESMQQTFTAFPIGENVTQVGTGVLAEAYVFGTVLEKGKNWIGGFISELILAGFSIILLWTLIRVSFASSEITAGTANKLYGFGTSLLKSVPIIPTKFGNMSAGAATMAAGDAMKSIRSGMMSRQAADADKMNALLGFTNANDITNKERAKVKASSSRTGTGMWSKIKHLQQTKPVTTTNNDFRAAVQQWILHNKNSLSRYGIANPNYFTNETVKNIWSTGNTDPDVVTMRRFIHGILSGNLPQNLAPSDLQSINTTTGSASIQPTYEAQGSS